MLTAQPMPLSNLAKIAVKYTSGNECASDFVRELVPLMAYGNKHIEFDTQKAEPGEDESCHLLLSKVQAEAREAFTESGGAVTLNLKLYRYPLQVMQRILDVASEDDGSREEH
ncbi:uncharacterized protein BcabD6B2_31670 [Babesia caballi]|uniref:Uncharacterized protein n=1 Tax=Babesia caballi TaxID=5871 RepID=A0AAV4LVS7_BABCB|nr:hypothetical protein, conserved [Babesia caballi]